MLRLFGCYTQHAVVQCSCRGFSGYFVALHNQISHSLPFRNSLLCVSGNSVRVCGLVRLRGGIVSVESVIRYVGIVSSDWQVGLTFCLY
jgi:hypothetical protein